MSDENFNCWLCGGAATTDATYSSVPLYRCADCGFLFAPQREIDDLHAIYDDGYFDTYTDGNAYDADAEQRTHEARIRLEWMLQYVAGGSVLEIGAADGSFLAEADASGFECMGVEPAPGPSAAARATRGLDVRTGFLETVELPDRRFDAVCAWHVLEHIPEPHDSIRRLRELTADDGVLLLEIPNIQSVKASAAGVSWFHLDPDNHVGFYTPPQLSRLLRDCGFELEHCDSVSAFSYQRAAVALKPRELAARALETVQTRALPGRPQPWKHELLRAVARPL